VLALWLLARTLRFHPDALRAIPLDPTRQLRLLVAATLAAHLAYYTFIVGGDHFEYRVYSALPPLVLLSGAWIVDRLVAQRAFRPNVRVEAGRIVTRPRTASLDAQEIRRCEAEFRARLAP
jgi:hypothetical protein